MLVIKLTRRSLGARGNCAPIELDITVCGGGPGVIGRHGTQQQLLPGSAVAIVFERANEGGVQRHRIVGTEGEAIAGAGGWVEIMHGIGQPTSLAHNWYRAIAQRNHLPKSAWLGARRDQE